MNTQIKETIFKHFPVLESERLIFRNFKEEDAQALFQLRSHSDVMRYMDAFPQKSMEEAQQLIHNNQQAFLDKTGLNWAIENKEDATCIGYIGFWRLIRHNVRAEIGYALSPNYWQKGYMSECFQTILPFAFEQLQVHSIEANVNPNNQASISLLEKHKFILEAHFKEDYFFDGKFVDSKIYSLLEPKD